MKNYSEPLLKNSKKTHKSSVANRLKGIFFAILCGICLHGNRIIVRVATDLSGISALEVTFYRSLFFFVTCYIFQMVIGVDVLHVAKENRGWLSFRSVIGFLGTWLHYITISHLPYETAVVLLFLYPDFTALLAWLILGEKISWWDFLALSLALLGVIVYGNPQWFGQPISSNSPHNSSNFLWIIVGVLSALTHSLVTISLRKLGPVMHYTIPSMYFSLTSVVISPLIFQFNASSRIETEYSWKLSLLFVGMGVFSFLGQTFNVLSYTYEKAAKVAAKNYLEIVYGFLFGSFLFGESIRVSDTVGGFLIVSCTFIISLVKCFKKDEKDQRAQSEILSQNQ